MTTNCDLTKSWIHTSPFVRNTIDPLVLGMRRAISMKPALTLVGGMRTGFDFSEDTGPLAALGIFGLFLRRERERDTSSHHCLLLAARKDLAMSKARDCKGEQADRRQNYATSEPGPTGGGGAMHV